MRNGLALLAMLAFLTGSLFLFSSLNNQTIKDYTKQVLKR